MPLTHPNYHATRAIPRPTSEDAQFKKGDTLVLFGELFNRGYANGLVEDAQRRNMNIIYSTVGRREKDGTLRVLNAEELAAASKPLINIALEAGFDMETNDQGQKIVDLLKDVKLTDWQDYQLPESQWAAAQKKGHERFRQSARAWAKELARTAMPDSNLLIAHLMAGGVPRAKIILPIMNRIFKGQGDRHVSSELFWNCPIGRLVAASFDCVTADTFQILIEETAELRQIWEKKGLKVSYTAYGYHGTEILIKNSYEWQTYSPYLQGFAKMKLEKISREQSKKGISCCVYNCPEILTNSSSIFNGVEVSLYPLLFALEKVSGKKTKAQQALEQCRSLLKPEHTLDELKQLTDDYLTATEIRNHCVFEKWPQHNNLEQMDLMLNSSEKLISMHKDGKQLITAVLSELVFDSCGSTMISDAWSPQAPVTWLNHDLIIDAII